MSEKIVTKNKKIGIYIHIPFCKKKCNYCAFNSYSGKNHLILDYFDVLKTEISFYLGHVKEFKIDTIYFGGGTPSYMPPSLINDILIYIKNNFNVRKNLEVTIECNPCTLSESYLKQIFTAGFNRLSIGLQSTSDEDLKILGRDHTFEDFRKIYKSALKVGFENISIDLIYGLYRQSLNDWKICLSNLLNFQPKHISCYLLEIEKGTPFYSSGLKFPDETKSLKMYDFCVKFLKENGYDRYEISNFSKPCFESRHNLKYWNYTPYVGFGAGAHSFIKGVRHENEKNIEKYIRMVKNGKLPVSSRIYLTVKDKMSEFMFLGLRTQKGIKITDFKQMFGVEIDFVFGSVIKKLLSMGLIKKKAGRIFLDNKYFYVSNKIFSEFLL